MPLSSPLQLRPRMRAGTSVIITVVHVPPARVQGWYLHLSENPFYPSRDPVPGRVLDPEPFLVLSTVQLHTPRDGLGVEPLLRL